MSSKSAVDLRVQTIYRNSKVVFQSPLFSLQTMFSRRGCTWPGGCVQSKQVAKGKYNLKMLKFSQSFALLPIVGGGVQWAFLLL